VLLGWTLLGGLDAAEHLAADAVQPAWGDMAYQLALLAASR
jgi:STE24 endopeptidase